jgi:hypothetical protein
MTYIGIGSKKVAETPSTPPNFPPTHNFSVRRRVVIKNIGMIANITTE